jgi:hypothetical protein
MPQISQQDYIVMTVSTLGTFSADQKAKLIEYYKRGVILDVAQRSAVGISRCICASYADVSTTRTYTFVFGGASLQSVTATETIEA